MLIVGVVLGTIILSAVGISVHTTTKERKEFEKKKVLYKKVTAHAAIKGILKTKKEDWKYSFGERTTWQEWQCPDTGVKIMVLYEEVGYMHYFKMRYNNERVLTLGHKSVVEYHSGLEEVLDESFYQENLNLFKESLSHLRFVENQYKMEQIKMNEKVKKEAEDTKAKKMEKIKNDLKGLLKQGDNLERFVKKGQVELEKNINENYIFVCIRIEQSRYVEIMYDKTKDKWVIEYFFKDEEQHVVVKALEDEIKQYIKAYSESYLKKPFNNASDIQEVKNRLGKNDFAEYGNGENQLEQQSFIRVREKAVHIQTRITELTIEKEWLTNESSHLLMETLVDDFTKLMKTYEKMKCRRDIEEDMIESLTLMEEKLVALEKETEQAKVREIRHRKEIIKVR